jgi:hypothetical protein
MADNSDPEVIDAVNRERRFGFPDTSIGVDLTLGRLSSF